MRPRSGDKIRQNINSADLSQGSLAQQKQAGLRLLRQKESTKHLANVVDNCSPARRCNSRYCPTCSNPKRHGPGRHIAEHQILKWDHSNYVPPAAGALSNNYQVRSGQKAAIDFDGLPLLMLHCVTINLAISPVEADLVHLTRMYRSRLRRALAGLSGDAMVRGKFDVVLKN